MSPLRLGPIAGRPAATSRRSGLRRTRALWLGLSAALVGALFLFSPLLLKKGVVKEQVRLPAAAIRNAAEGARITELGGDETRAELEGGKFVKLPKAEVFYWAEFQKDELAGEVSVTPDGAVAEVLRWKCITEPAGEDSKKSAGPRPVKGKRP